MDRNRGFTLIELIATLAVMAILSAVAAPLYFSIIKGDTATTQANNLVAILDYARSEAVRQDVAVTVCPSSDGQNCGGDWTQELIATCSWSSGNSASNCDPNGTTFTTLRVQTAIPSGYQLLVSGSTVKVTFQPSGLAVANGNYGSTISFTLCDSALEPQFARDIEVLATGRTEVSPYPGKNFLQQALTC